MASLMPIYTFLFSKLNLIAITWRRSLGGTFQKIKIDLKGNNEADIIQNFRRERQVTEAAVRCIFLLMVIFDSTLFNMKFNQ